MTFVVLIFAAIMELTTPVQAAWAMADITGDVKSPVFLIPIVNRFAAGFTFKAPAFIVNAISYLVLVIDAIVLAINFPNNVTYLTGALLILSLVVCAITWFIITWQITNYGKLPYETSVKYVIMTIVFPYGIAYASAFNKKKLANEKKRKEVLGL